MSVSSVTSTASTASTTGTSTSSSNDIDLSTADFLKLITTQLENQSPLDPTDTTEFMGQLMSYATFNQISEISTTLDTLVDTISTMNSTVTSLYESTAKASA
ncbi:flagellar hook capping FlgD N-terminal domain-containing protein [Rhodoplanes sp. SY1]|uniref:flagellar hook capping FlgD N-terminal domain-containing protein n=1 Tax=Rhodoplanes sp. SY1 TaxID=3166646 RepID=UPI0038B5297C